MTTNGAALVCGPVSFGFAAGRHPLMALATMLSFLFTGSLKMQLYSNEDSRLRLSLIR